MVCCLGLIIFASCCLGWSDPLQFEVLNVCTVCIHGHWVLVVSAIHWAHAPTVIPTHVYTPDPCALINDTWLFHYSYPKFLINQVAAKLMHSYKCYTVRYFALAVMQFFPQTTLCLLLWYMYNVCTCVFVCMYQNFYHCQLLLPSNSVQ